MVGPYLCIPTASVFCSVFCKTLSFLLSVHPASLSPTVLLFPSMTDAIKLHMQSVSCPAASFHLLPCFSRMTKGSDICHRHQYVILPCCNEPAITHCLVILPEDITDSVQITDHEWSLLKCDGWGLDSQLQSVHTMVPSLIF